MIKKLPSNTQVENKLNEVIEVLNNLGLSDNAEFFTDETERRLTRLLEQYQGEIKHG